VGPEPEFARLAAIPAIGCGLRMLGHNPFGIELLKEEFAPTNVFDVVKTALATAVTLLFLVVLGVTFATREQGEAETFRFRASLGAAETIFRVPEEAYLKSVKARTEPQAKQDMDRWLRGTIPQDHSRIDTIRRRLLDRHRELEGQLGLARNIPEVPSALKVWYELYKVFMSVPRAELGAFFRINKLDITERQCSLTLEVDDLGVLDKARVMIERSEYFRTRARKPNEILEAGRVVPKDGHHVMDITLQFKEEG
jgi:hypothetical protein